MYVKWINRKGKQEIINMKIALDSGNELVYPVISTNVVDELKIMGVIPKTIKLKHSKAQVFSAAGEDMAMRGILAYRIPIQTKNEQQLPFKKYYVVDNLVNDINLGKSPLTQLNCKWTFKEDEVSVLEERMKLSPSRPMSSSCQVQTLITK